ncbi:amidase [soil metagenome]
MATDSLDRRDLFRLGVTAGVTVLVSGCRTSTAPQSSGIAAPARVPSQDLVEVSIAELQKRMESGAETAVGLVAKYRARIEATNETGPMLRSVLELAPDAEATARKLDAERAAGKLRGPLHGIPMLVKDNLDTGDKMTTTAGSMALAGTRAKQDSAVVARLRAAGAIILGKTNMSEWANIRGAASVSGWSARGGQCRNPYALDRSPSGSSSGSGSATAASLCAASIGTETDGSITSPASCCSLVGLKPTVGLVSRAGIIPISSTQDTAGPMTRTVSDAAIVLTAIAGPDPADPATASAKPEDYTKYLDPDALRGARIGVPRAGWFGLNRYMDKIAEAAIVELRRLGAVIVDPIDLPQPAELGPAEFEVLLYELKATLDAYLRVRGAYVAVHSLADVIAFNEKHTTEELGLFGQEHFVNAQTKGPLTEKAYLDAVATCQKLARTEGLDKAMDANKLDAIFAGTGGPPWLIDPVNGDAFGPSATTLPAVAGYPHITVPAGQVRGLPMGISFIGRAYTEGKLLGYAFAYEQATKLRKPPALLPTATDS